MNALTNLKEADFQTRCLMISTADALRAFLLRSPEVRLLDEAIRSYEITYDDIREFVGALFRSFSRGTRFAHEIEIAAIAATLETHSGSFAQEYLGNLTNLNIQELPLAIRVARLCLSRQKEIAIGTTERRVTGFVPTPGLQREFRAVEVVPISPQNTNTRTVRYEAA